MSLPFQQLCLFEGFLILTCTCLRYVFNLSSYFINRTVWVVQVYSIHTISDLKSASKPQGRADLFACHSRPVHVNYLGGAPFFYSELI